MPGPVQFFTHHGDGGNTSGSCLRGRKNADVAQLVAHHLAKVRVAGSSPVVRSTAAATRSWIRRMPDSHMRRRGRVVQARACKALYAGSIPAAASRD